MEGSWEENEPLSEINVTPFVDVLLVLLIIFMVTAPIVNHVIQVDLPEDSYNQDKKKQNIFLHLQTHKEIFPLSINQVLFYIASFQTNADSRKK